MKSQNPYTRIRKQAAEIDTYRGHLLSYEQTYSSYKKKAENTMKNANMDICLLMTIIKDIRPCVIPGALDSVVRENIAKRGVSPATADLVKMIQDTRQPMFIPIAQPIAEVARRSSTPVTEAGMNSKAFGVEEEEEEAEEEEELLFGEAAIINESYF